MSDIAIKVENLSKAYQLGQIGTGTVSNDIHRWWSTKIRGKEDPFLKIGESNDRSVKGESNVVWSLKDINFEINQGDAVGIIGKNGAGKSTLLKLLSRVTAPTTGNIKVKGRIASLLEVGTGFHPELTGRENIYLNGAILGMRKKEIARKFDEIVDFSGVERYIDTPVKRYSSGMYVRLAFAVAAHLESEILIVDEVLAVGDAEFQKKCLGKMGDVSKGQGKTVLFVSHNLYAIQELCSKSILLKHGCLQLFSDTQKIINIYSGLENKKSINKESIKLNDVVLNNFEIANDNIIYCGQTLQFSFVINNNSTKRIKSFVNLEISNSMDISAFCVGNEFNNVDIEIDKNNLINLQFNVENINLVPGSYKIKIYYCDNIGNTYYSNVDELSFNIENVDFLNSGGKIPRQRQHGLIVKEYNKIEKSDIKIVFITK